MASGKNTSEQERETLEDHYRSIFNLLPTIGEPVEEGRLLMHLRTALDKATREWKQRHNINYSPSQYVVDGLGRKQ